MAHFTLHFLGQFRISANKTPITDFYSDKARALLAYLALEPRDHARSALAGLLWPEIGEHYARTNLRNTLYQLRQTLDRAASGAADQLLTVARQSICFKPDHATVDVLHFQALLERAQTASLSDLDSLEETIRLYQGELLLGFGVADAPAFEEWLLLRRELLHQQALVACQRLATAHESAGRYEQAHAVVGRLLLLDPYREETYQRSMRLLAHMGQPGRALQQVEQLRRVLHEEMGVDPSAETLALARQIAAGVFDQPTKRQEPILRPPQADEGMQPAPPPVQSVSHRPAAMSPLLDLRNVPDPGPFFGRVAEQQQIVRCLGVDRCRVVAILGLGGIGKTSLAAQCVHELATGSDDEPYDAIFWHSLVNAPPLTELLPPLLQILSDQQLTPMPESVDAQLRLLLSYLRQRRVLLVLDNMESILEPERAGAYRPGYEPYGQLIQQVATLNHQSQLLLTSRERPHSYRRLEQDSQLVQSLQLTGLDHAAGQQLLMQRGLLGNSGEEAQLIGRYSGNPLALKLVADTVGEIFGGDIAEFLREETLVFDDIRAVLDQQFARLTELEQGILFWLAIEREPTSAVLLRSNLLQPLSQRALLEALLNLQRRSLIERHVTGFALQNVITEYLTGRLVFEAIVELEQGDLKLLHRYPLLKAQAKEYVRQSQARLLLQPVATQLKARMGFEPLQAHLKWQLDRLRIEAPSYAGGNLFNLLVQLEIELADYDFSHLHLRQAHLQGVSLSNVNLAYADLTGSTFTQRFGEVPSTAISPDGRLLASGAESGDITIWQLSDYQPLMSLEGHSSNVSELVFSPDGRQLASSSIDGTIRLWDTESGQTIWVIECDQKLVFSVAFSPDGRLLASGGAGSFVYLWDACTAKLICQLEAHPDGATRAVAFHPDGTTIGAANLGGYIFLWNIAHLYQADAHTANTNAEVVRYTIPADDGGRFIALGFSPDGARFAGGDGRGVIRVWDMQTRQLLRTLRGHEASVRSVEFSPDNGTLVSSSFDQTVRLWDVEREQCDAVLSHQGVVWSATFSPDGQTLVSSGEDSILRIWKIEPPRRAEMVKMIQGCRCIIPTAAFSPAEPLLALGDSLGTIRLWNIDQGKPIHVCTLKGHDRVETLAFSPDGQCLASAGGIHDHAIRLWDMTTKQCVAVLQGHTQRVRSLAFTLDGALLASAAEDAVIWLWDVRNPRDCRTHYVLHKHQNIVFNLTFNANGTQFASSSDDHTIRIWDTVTGRELQRLVGLGGNEVVAFSPTADILACSAGNNGDIRLLDLSNPQAAKQLMTLSGHVHEPVSVSFNPEGNQLVSGSSDTSVRLWDIHKGKQIYVLDKHKAYVKFVKFSPAGQHFFSTSSDGIAHLWDAKTGTCVHTFHAPHPYDGMNITGVTGISQAQRAALKALGAVETG